MMQNVFKHISGIEIYGIFSICLFFTVFTVSMIWAALQRKPLMAKMGALPLDDQARDLPSRGGMTHE